MHKYCIFWFRRDLRLEDNHGLYRALKSGYQVLPLFIFDTNILSSLPKKDARVAFIYNRLRTLDNLLSLLGSGILVLIGKPSDIWRKLISEFSISEVHMNEDYEPYAIARDREIKEMLAALGVLCNVHKDQVLYAKDEVIKENGDPYVVYTPYSRKWLAKLELEGIQEFPSEHLLNNMAPKASDSFPTLEDIGFEQSSIQVPEHSLTQSLIDGYEANRNFPAIEGTSHLGPHLRFGSYSIRKAVRHARKSKNNTFLKELAWREFFMQILWHFPQTVTQSFKPDYDRIQWRNDESEFRRWCEGNTGFPLVDAGMRELNETGFMHNRVRMLVGSFLCKHLLIDWRWGEAYFAEKLLDYEQASNIGNWQWVAGCGVDAAPYFRIFNPSTQVKKFDKEGIYIQRWVPEFNELNYSSPMVDHKMARERCLAAYKKALT